ncbi:MAG: AarF/ABC1/UbiB kinase family protein [Alphaproteobacteria bacterium]|nr:AarF/ABC1/UbiB kinase family protein [Alphaproteobacteria bacterium]
MSKDQGDKSKPKKPAQGKKNAAPKDAATGGKPKADSERSTVGGRIKRYARVSTTMTGLAAKLAGQKYLGLDIDKPQHAKQLMESLGNLKGPLLKVAQLLATIPNALPKEYAAELQKLQSQAPPMGWLFVRRRMATELGRDWESKFKSFERDAAAAASLGQVHRAVTHDGRNVACKLQYPDMSAAVEADLGQLKLVMGIFEKYDQSVVTGEIQKEIAARLHEELDYALEARHAALYAHMLADEKGVHVPKVVPELSTGRLVTTTWLEGASILDFIDAKQDVRNRIAHNMFRAWYVPLYFYGIIHGDPHLGNYTVQKDQTINLLDFGCVRIFPPRFVEGVITLYHALQKEDRAMAVAAYECWGFSGLTKETIDVLNMWAGFLYGPVLDDRVRPIGVVEEGVYGRDVASKVHRELKRIGGVRVPREFVFMDRAALGLGSVFLHLRAEINWHNLFHELVADFDADKLAARQAETLSRFDLTATD